jgi:hypothetical protein
MVVEMGIEMEKGYGMDVIKEIYTNAENRESSEEKNKLAPSQSERGWWRAVCRGRVMRVCYLNSRRFQM